MKKVISIAMVMMLAVATLFAGGTGEATAANSGKNLLVSVWAGPHADLQKQVVADYPDANVTIDDVDYGNLKAKQLTSFQATPGSGNYDVVWVNSLWMKEYTDAGYILPLNDYIEASGLDTSMYSKGLLDGCTFDGQIYGFPTYAQTMILVYDKAAFEEEGLEVPTTYEELADVAKQISEITGRPSVGFDSMDNLGIYGPINFGAQYADPQGNLYIFDENNIDATMEFYRWWQKGIQEGYFRTAGEDQYCSGPFSNGTIIAYIGSSSGTSYIQPDGFECGVTYAPVGPNPAVIQQGGNFCGFTTGDPVVDLATSIFLEYMYDAEASGLYAANTGYAPSSKAGLDTEAYKASIAAGGIAAEAKDISATYPDGVLAYDPVFENSYETRLALSDVVEAIALDENADIEALIAEAERTIAAL